MFRRVKETNYLLWIQTKIEGQLESLRFHKGVWLQKMVPYYSPILTPNQLPYLFIHLPKTAGTSVRKALEEQFGWHMVLCDYGVNEGRSSSLIRKKLSISSVGELREKMKSYRVICGHVGLQKYLMLSGLSRCFTFVRDPLQRSYSAYEHARRLQGFQGSLKDYVPRQSNLQSRLLNGLPLESLAFVGISERYQESLGLLQNQLTGLVLKEFHENINDAKYDEKYQFTEEEETLLREHNQQDLALYQKATTLFEERVEAQRLGVCYQRGGLQVIQPNLIQGWLSGAGLAPRIQALLNENVITQSAVSEFRPGLACWGIERDGFVGFSLRNNKIDLTECIIQLDDPSHRILRQI